MIEARNFPADFCTRNFLERGKPRCRHSIVAVSPGYSDITTIDPRSPIAIGNHLDRAKRKKKLLRRLAPLTFFILVQAFRNPLGGELPHVQISMNDGPNPLT
jgi:hypothetical protein